MLVDMYLLILLHVDCSFLRTRLSLCWSVAQEPPVGRSTLDSSASSMDHDHDEAQESASMPGNQHDPILAVNLILARGQLCLCSPAIHISSKSEIVPACMAETCKLCNSAVHYPIMCLGGDAGDRQRRHHRRSAG